MLKSTMIMLGICIAALSGYSATPVVISEFLANNNNSISDETGSKEDWIEIHNVTTTNVSLSGWYLTDTVTNLIKWQFPATNIAPNGYMIVWASNKDKRTAGAPLHTNFKLDNDGEYLALVQPDGITVASAYTPSYPQQAADVSYGLATDAHDVSYVNTGTVARAIVPANGNLGLGWTERIFDDSTWQNGTVGVGYDRNAAGVDYTPLIGLNVEAGMYNINQTVYIRVPFVVTNVAEIDTLNLALWYDDGAAVFLNGQPIVSDNAPSPLAFDSAAVTNRPDGLAFAPRNFNVTASRDLLLVGTNVLAIQGLNNGIASSDLLIFPQLTGRTIPSGAFTKKFFPIPTPGAANNEGVTVLGPIVSDVKHTPNVPQTNEAITVTAKVRAAFSPVSAVKLRYRVMFGSETEISMLDDGAHGDGLANDGTFGAFIPSGIATNGQMIRWYVRATDLSNVVTRIPSFVDPLRGPEYMGTITSVQQTNNLEILHWFIQVTNAADNATGSRASLFFLGEFYDNVGMNLHGQSSSGFPKKSYDIDFHKGYNFRWAAGEKRVDDLNLLTIYPDKAHVRNVLAYETFRDGGTPYHFVRPVRVHQNGIFFSDAHMVENGDENYLDRVGLDTQGALYKMYNTLNVATGEKKTRKDEGTEDLQALINGALLPSGTLRNAYFFDNLNIPEITSYLAAQTITGNTDCCHKNYYLYRDSVGTGEWQILPWDVDLSFGRVWSGTPTYWDDVLYTNTALFIGNNNTLMSAFYATPELRQMYLRRVRTLMEQLLQPPGTPAAEGRYEQRLDQLLAQIAPDAALDLAKWGTWCCGSAGPYTQATIPQPANYQTMAQAVALIKTNYLPGRRAWLFNAQTITAGGEIPLTQPLNTTILITSLDYSPASSNQLQEYIELRNTNNFAADLSGWRLSGGIDFTFPQGVVMPANSYLYVSPDAKSFRARTSGPRGGQGLYVVGPYKGQLSARGESVTLSDTYNRVITTTNYPPAPSLAQQYLRITELMYHPTPMNGNTNSGDEYEFIELKNVGPTTLDLTQVRFINGITFNFTGSAITNLAPGGRVLVVKNVALFTARYGSGLPVAGQYDGYLDNSGERIQLVDAVGEEVLDFSFNNAWYPITDGLGFSLVVVNDLAAPDEWGKKSQWRTSSTLQGSPGVQDPAAPTFAPVIINEVLSRTVGVPDAIELYNPGSNVVDLSGWYLTDDFNTPFKYRITNGTTIAAGGYRVFTESNFNANPGLGTSFALSSDGDEAYLFAVDNGGNLNGYVHGFSFGASEESVSFGRYVTSEGKEHFVAQNSVTLGTDNSGPKVGPVVISEIMYHPPDIGTNDNTAAEFVELMNITGSPVALFDPARPTNTWKLTGGLSYTLPTNVTLAAGEAVLLVNVSPTNATEAAAFRAAYGLSTNVRLFGPLTGKLDNDSDTVTLRKPTTPLTNGVPYAIADQVEYTDDLPWPKAADGLGFSLQRWNVTTFGNEPTNWITTVPSPGAMTYTNGQPPVVTSNPADQNALVGQTIVIAASVSGTAPLAYQWLFNGTNLVGATNVPLVITNAQLANGGTYELIVYNAVGAVFSSKATVIVRVPVQLTQQPTNIDVRVQPDPLALPSTNVTLSMQAMSTLPITYQWRKNGVPIPGATNNQLTLVNVTTNDWAAYSGVAMDAISTATTTNAWVYPLVTPTVTEQPIAQTVAVNSRVSLSVGIRAWPPPFNYAWAVGPAIQTNYSSEEQFTIHTFTAPPTNVTRTFRVQASNRAGSVLSGTASVVTVADADGDGIPDNWESAYGFLPNDASDRLGDADSDGMSNWAEYQAGTDPTNALSVLKMVSMITNGTLQLRFDAMSNKTYTVQYVTSVTDTNWQKVISRTATRTNRAEVISAPVANTNRYYRVTTPAIAQ